MILPPKLHNKVVSIVGDYEIINSYREGSIRTGVWKIKSKKYNQKYFIDLLGQFQGCNCNVINVGKGWGKHGYINLDFKIKFF